MSYDNFLIFKSKQTEPFNNIALVDKYLESVYGTYGDHDWDKYYDVHFIAIHQFPIELILELLNYHMHGNEYYTHTLLHIEIIKYVYSIWNKYDNISYFDKPLTYPHNELYEYCYTIKQTLLYFTKCTKEQYITKLKQPSECVKSMYGPFWLYGYFPLLDCDDGILHFLSIAFLDDGQDTFMYGIYQMEPTRLSYFMMQMVELLTKHSELDKQYPRMNCTVRYKCFDLDDGGTGALGQFEKILEKLEMNGINLLAKLEIAGYHKLCNSMKKFGH